MRQVPGTFSLHGGQIELPEDFGFTDAIPHYGSGLEKMPGTPVIVADGSGIGVMTGHRRGTVVG
jgi:hypothetical protein